VKYVESYILLILIPGGASTPPDPPIKSAWRPPNMDMYSGCYIHNMDIYIPEYIYIYIHIMNITSRIYIQIWVIWVPMLQMDRSGY
jgi:hypothetical protein